MAVVQVITVEQQEQVVLAVVVQGIIMVPLEQQERQIQAVEAVHVVDKGMATPAMVVMVVQV